MLKARINKSGLIQVMRKNQWKYQDCPYSRSIDFGLNCGDWCPVFCEGSDGIVTIHGCYYHIEEDDRT